MVTFGGNSNGAKCYFPFKYQGKVYDSCIDREHRGEDGSVTQVKFCATTADFDADKKWVKYYKISSTKSN